MHKVPRLDVASSEERRCGLSSSAGQRAPYRYPEKIDQDGHADATRGLDEADHENAIGAFVDGAPQGTHVEQHGQRSHLQCDAEQDRHYGEQIVELPWQGVRGPMSEEAERKGKQDTTAVIVPLRKMVSIGSSFGSCSSKRLPFVALSVETKFSRMLFIANYSRRAVGSRFRVRSLSLPAAQCTCTANLQRRKGAAATMRRLGRARPLFLAQPLRSVRAVILLGSAWRGLRCGQTGSRRC